MKNMSTSKIVILILLLTFLGSVFLLIFEGKLGINKFKHLLMQRLTKVEVMPSTDVSPQLRSSTAIYVLGGAPNSLKRKFKIAADLYHQGYAAKIFILSKSGITEYSPFLQRNLTNNEWAIGELTRLGVPNEDIEPLELVKGFFGTCYEARTVAPVVSNRDYKNLILVTGPSHTMRTWLCFSKFVKGLHLNLYIYMSNEPTGWRGLLVEYLKLVIYKIFLL